MGVISNNWFDCALLSILYMFKPSCWPMLKPPSLGPPVVPLTSIWYVHIYIYIYTYLLLLLSLLVLFLITTITIIIIIIDIIDIRSASTPRSAPAAGPASGRGCRYYFTLVSTEWYIHNIYIYMCIYIYIYIYVYTYLSLSLYIYIYTHLSIYLSIYLSIPLSLYTYIYIYTYITYIYIYVCMNRGWRNTFGNLTEFVWLKHKPITVLILLVYVWNAEGYDFIALEISNSTNSTVFRQPLAEGTFCRGDLSVCPLGGFTGAQEHLISNRRGVPQGSPQGQKH